MMYLFVKYDAKVNINISKGKSNRIDIHMKAIILLLIFCNKFVSFIFFFRILEHEEKGGYFFALTDEEIKSLIHSGKTCIMCCKPEVIDTIMQ